MRSCRPWPDSARPIRRAVAVIWWIGWSARPAMSQANATMMAVTASSAMPPCVSIDRMAERRRKPGRSEALTVLPLESWNGVPPVCTVPAPEPAVPTDTPGSWFSTST
jgi:hypothetical protein